MKTGPRGLDATSSAAGTESSPTVVGNAVYFGDTAGNRRLAEDPRRPRELDLPRQRRDQGRPGVRRRQPVLRRLQRPRLRASTPATATRCGASAPTARISASARATSTPPRRSRSAACTWATPTGACTRSPSAPASSPGRPAPAPTCTARRPSPRSPGLGPTVYIGSYDGNFYAFNAQSGAVRWRHAAGGRISGSATIVGDVVYYSNLGLEDHRRPRRPHRPAGVLVLRRRVQPGDRRPPARSTWSATARSTRCCPRRSHRRHAAAQGQARAEVKREAKRRARKQRSTSKLVVGHPDTPRRLQERPQLGPAERAFGRILVCLLGLCVVVVEVTVSGRPRPAVGSARTTRRSSIACARSSRMPPRPASAGAVPSGRRRAVAPAAMSLVSRPPRTAMHAPRPGTWKRPPSAAA